MFSCFGSGDKEEKHTGLILPAGPKDQLYAICLYRSRKALEKPKWAKTYVGPENLILKKHFHPACLCKGMIKSSKDNFRCQSLVDSLEQIFSSPFPAVHLTAFSHRFTLTQLYCLFFKTVGVHFLLVTVSQAISCLTLFFLLAGKDSKMCLQPCFDCCEDKIQDVFLGFSHYQ